MFFKTSDAALEATAGIEKSAGEKSVLKWGRRALLSLLKKFGQTENSLG